MPDIRPFLDNVKKLGYVVDTIYSSGIEIKYVKLLTPTWRKAVLIQFPDSLYSYSSQQTCRLTQEDHNYKNCRQRSYLDRFGLDRLACVSSQNICVKSANLFFCYTIDYVEDRGEFDDASDDECDSDIEIDDYPIQDIFPVICLGDNEEITADLEDHIVEIVTTITREEEEKNELAVEKLLGMFDAQKTTLKNAIFEIHRDIYHVLRDLEDTSESLTRIRTLIANMTHEKDRVRFRADRLATDAEAKIDTLNEKLRTLRNLADKKITNYRRYIDKFNHM